MSTTITRGIVSAYRRPANRVQDGNDLKLIQGDAVIHGGNSGGAMVDRFGNVVAVTVAGFVMGDRKVGTSINYYIPVADALKFLAVELASRTRHSRKRSNRPRDGTSNNKLDDSDGPHRGPAYRVLAVRSVVPPRVDGLAAGGGDPARELACCRSSPEPGTGFDGQLGQACRLHQRVDAWLRGNPARRVLLGR